MGLSDLHIHTTYSWDGTAKVREVLEHAAHRAGLDVIAITDHDELRGSLEAREQAWRHDLEIVTGMEVTTAEGHVLALYIEQPVEPGLSLNETLHRVGELGGLCIAAHPMARWTPSLSAEAIRQALRQPDLARVLVGIEYWNAGLVRKASNARAQALAAELNVARVGNSDSHLAWSIGFAASRFLGHTANDLRAALEAHTTEALLRQTAVLTAYVAGWTVRKARLALASARPIPAGVPA